MYKRFVEDEHLMIARGNSYIYSSYHGYGHRDTPTTGVFNTIWNGTALDPFLPDVAAPLGIYTAAVGDEGKEITVRGLDANYLEIEEVVTLNAVASTTSVLTTKSFLRVNFAFDSNGVDITNRVFFAHGVNILAEIAPGYNQTLSAQYTVPAGKTLYLYSIGFISGKGGDAEYQFVERPPNKIWQIRHIANIIETSYTLPYSFPVRFDEKTDLKFRYKPLQNPLSSTGVADWILVNAVD